MSRFLLAFVLLCVIGITAHAEPPPVPERKTKSLEILRERLEQEQKIKNRLDAEMKSAEKSLADTRKKMKETSRSIRSNEQRLVTLEKKIGDLAAEEATIAKRLQHDYGSMANLAMALQRIGKIPSQALILRPGAPLETARSAIVMKSVIPVLTRRAKSLSTDIERLRDIRETLGLDKQEARQAQAILHKEYEKIESLGKQKETQYGNLSKNYQETSQRLDRIAREAKTMGQLMEKLRADAAISKKSTGQHKITALPSLGNARLPVAGSLLRAYGEKDEIGAVSEGIKISASPSALVVAPMGGIVRFAGEFKNYGRIVILEHTKGYHSLLAGLENIGVHPGETLDPGEPVGRLPSASSRGDAPTLYYELRRNGQPVNPSDKFAELKS